MATNGKSNGKKNGKKNGAERSPPLARWVYAYQLDPPQPEPRFKKLTGLVRQAQTAAKRDGRLWTGRIVVEALVTHLLIVTDHPGQVPTVNRAIETELKQLDMGFAMTGPAALPLASAPRAKGASRSGLAGPLEKISPLRARAARSQ
jgi:hypothetical protein